MHDTSVFVIFCFYVQTFLPLIENRQRTATMEFGKTFDEGLDSALEYLYKNIGYVILKLSSGSFRTKMRRAQEHVRKILDTERTATLASDCQHTYFDKQ